MKLKEKISSLPVQPGCYLYKGEGGKVIYVGKAKNLKKRVSSYFQKKDLDPKTTVLVSKIKDVDFIVTPSEVEALILENNLIKKYYPRYNIDLKDSRRYAYIKVIKDSIPFIEVVRKRDGEGEYYGPFTSGKVRRDILDVLRREFQIFMKKPSSKLRKVIDIEEYNKKFLQARKILKGEVEEVIRELKKEMQVSSKRKLYEHALIRKNQIKSLEVLKEKQIMELRREIDAHIINYLVDSEKIYLLVFKIRKGILEGKQRFVFDYREGVIEEFIVRFYSNQDVPQEIILPEKIDDSVKNYLEKLRGSKVKFIVPERGDKKLLLDLVLKNVEAAFFSGIEGIIDLSKQLDLEKLPRKIECFDISHLGGRNTTASMVVFKDGKEDKSNYRKFRIRTETLGDDFLAMEEVTYRRYSKVKRESLTPPDLILIDGGLGQLGVVAKVLKKLNLDIPIISLAKKLEEVYVQGNSRPISLPRKSKGLLLLRRIRDEAHRFAINYNRLLRKKEAVGK